MNAPSLAKRMDNLEKIVEPLRGLPDRVTALEVQVVQLRTEMRDESSAIRRDMVTKDDLVGFATKDDLAAAVAPLATKAEMRMLHEDLVERLKVIGEGLARPSKRPGKAP